MFSIHNTISGFFKLKKFNTETNKIIETPWMKNLVLDSGLNALKTGGFLSTCYVGTGSSVPEDIQTHLDAQIASTTTVQSNIDFLDPISPYSGYFERCFRFPAGSFTAVIREVGIGPSSNLLFARMLIVDDFGIPTIFSIETGETLDVFYRLYIFPQLTDTISTVIARGISYTITSRMANVGNSLEWVPSLINTSGVIPLSNVNKHTVYNGTIGSIFNSPSGSASANVNSITEYSYIPYSMELKYNLYLDLATGSLNNGVKSILTHTTLGVFQHELNPVIPKTGNYTLAFDCSISWSKRL